MPRSINPKVMIYSNDSLATGTDQPSLTLEPESRLGVSSTRMSVPLPAALVLPATFIAAVLSQGKVVDCPHNLYKYPARFAPEFARETIRAFSEVGDVIIDPFCGGSTSLIEAVAEKRRAIGFDISSLACFLGKVKTSPLSIHDQREMEIWVKQVNRKHLVEGATTWTAQDTDQGYYRRNLSDELVAVFAGILHEIQKLPCKRQQAFARLVLLSVGQCALDCKKTLPDREAIRTAFCSKFTTYLCAFRDYTWCLSRRTGRSHLSLERERRIINASAEHAVTASRFPAEWGLAKLVVTSPPYPGVHMLYHRWQLLGRRETPAPFLLANCRDGDGVAHYNLGGRHSKGLSTYYDRVETIFAALIPRLHSNALVVQMVAFNRPDQQLPAYLTAMSAAGYSEVPVTAQSEYIVDGRLWRPVPGRRWYAAKRADGAAGKEVVLIHRPNPSTVI